MTFGAWGFWEANRSGIGASWTGSIKANATVAITVERTGGSILQLAPAVTGPWTDIPATASPYVFTASGKVQFGKIKR